MEHMRLLIAIGMSFAVFLLWSIFFGPEPVQKPVAQTEQLTESKSEAPPDRTTLPAATVQAPQTPVTDQGVAQPSRPARKIVVNTPLYRMTLSEQGAAVVSMILNNYRETVQEESPLKELIPEGLDGGTALLSMSGVNEPGLSRGLYDADNPADEITLRGKPAEIRFSYTTGQNVRIEKIYRFTPDSYLVDLVVTVRNGSETPLSGTLGLGLRDLFGDKVNAYGFEGPSGLINGSLEQVKVKDIEEENMFEGNIRWVAIERLYFMNGLISKAPVDARMVLAKEDDLISSQLVASIGEIKPSDQRSFEFGLFMGPKSISVLRQVGNELDRAINFGWVDLIAKPCLWFMNFIYGFIPNYGIAIIILTIVTRLLFWPLAQKSYKSMNDMRKLQPLMQEIREKYKNDKARINQETMALYRTYKINPMGGCLPMLVQLPVFFALYRMLYQAIELRHAPFFGWINDLSAPDRLFHFGFQIPFMEAPYGVPVLTLIMGASMLLQQKMSPAPGDPTQAKMMMLMPVVFTFIFINFPSGLVLYWFVSNLVSIAQQYYTQ
jgi:YidC/Oxa1 family membrane protein insertase